jgi:hypothetical protein
VAFLPPKRKAFAMSLTKVVGSRVEPVLAALLFAVSYMVGIFALTMPQLAAPDATWQAFWRTGRTGSPRSSRRTPCWSAARRWSGSRRSWVDGWAAGCSCRAHGQLP